jgi:mRNA interferase MazF
MTTYERGDVVLVPFPFTDQSATKKRPAAIISSDIHNRLSADVVIMAITSRIQRTGTMECLISDWHSAGLLMPSALKPAISTLEQAMILRRLGKLSADDLAAMDAVLRKLFALPLHE